MLWMLYLISITCRHSKEWDTCTSQKAQKWPQIIIQSPSYIYLKGKRATPGGSSSSNSCFTQIGDKTGNKECLVSFPKLAFQQKTGLQCFFLSFLLPSFLSFSFLLSSPFFFLFFFLSFLPSFLLSLSLSFFLSSFPFFFLMKRNRSSKRPGWVCR